MWPDAVTTHNSVLLAPDYPITTARLRLRPLGVDDVDALVGYRSLAAVCRYVPFEPMSRAAVEEKLASAWAARTLEAEGTGLFLGVELVETGELVGDLMLYFKSLEHQCGEVGWVQDPSHCGHGYMTEAARALLGLGFDGLGLHRIIARVDARNLASQRLCERLGMRQEAHLLQNEWFKGQWTDELDYAKLASEWRSSRSASRHRD